ncbi:hypothetical protein C0583_03250 [Candidatus Parcubacteria bacterium]|nr:MAG: hypothetical protein C0583_03250 [Candidatus Parcubacteria bacterium]
MKIKTRSINLSDKILVVFFIFTLIVIFLVKFLTEIDWAYLFILAYILLTVAFIFAYTISRWFSKRLANVVFKIEEMAAGNFSENLKTGTKDEIGQLAHAVNELMSRLNTGIAQDVSKHKELSQAKTDFVALASHQLRTPLSIIKWYIDFVLAGDAGEMNEEQHKYLTEAYESNERLIDLVNALLDVSRIDVGTFSIEPEPTDITERADKALEKFTEEIKEKKLHIERLYDDIPLINLDRRLTKMFFENLISNSVKYTPEGGTVQIVLRKTEKDVLIKISDNGCGIPREQQPNVFTKMFRADNVKRMESVGTGLGLYITKAIIEKSGGRIWFQSPSFDLLLDPKKQSNVPIDKQNQGTTFFITIPLQGMKRKIGTKKLNSIE